MEALKMLNVSVRFVLELCLLAAIGYWGFKTQTAWPAKILLGIGLPVFVAVIWGACVSPKAVYTLPGSIHLILEMGLLALGAVALFASGKPVLGGAYTIILIVNKILLVVWKQ
ncbi:MAG: YrdB family protein [Chloroflexi bacterium]|jgi:hypothetical protein|nr:YrdB family protein [Anaerolineaceae bacterium]NMB87868.1 YrdB family protein [Chloroflexota bacterium]